MFSSTFEFWFQDAEVCSRRTGPQNSLACKFGNTAAEKSFEVDRFKSGTPAYPYRHNTRELVSCGNQRTHNFSLSVLSGKSHYWLVKTTNWHKSYTIFQIPGQTEKIFQAMPGWAAVVPEHSFKWITCFTFSLFWSKKWWVFTFDLICKQVGVVTSDRFLFITKTYLRTRKQWGRKGMSKTERQKQELCQVSLTTWG